MATADTISFYGKPVSKIDVLDDKRKFADRWPMRAYSVWHGTEQVSCDGACTVQGVVEWFAGSPERGKMSSGSAEFTLVRDPSSEKIVSEIGKVISQQRLCIARSIAVKPEVILFDEPTSALDPLSTEKIEQLIGELKGDFTIVIVTHNMQQAARCADNTAFFYLGKLIEAGETARMFTAPTDPRTKDYIAGRFG